MEYFWVTVYKTLCPMLSDSCLSVLSILSVTLVYCGQTAGCIKMPLGMEVGLSPGDFVLEEDATISPIRWRRPLPNFQPMSIVAKWLHGSRCPLVWR